METPDLVLAIAVPLVTLGAGWIGVEMSLTPPERQTKEQRKNYRVAFIMFTVAAIALNIWQTARNSQQQKQVEAIGQKKEDDSKQREEQLSNKVSEQGGKLDAIAHFEQQFLTFAQQRPSGASDKAYEAMATAVMKLAQGSGSTPPPPPGGRLQIVYEGSELNGKTLTMSGQNGLIQLSPFHTKNIGTRATGAVSIRLYFNKPVGATFPGWQPTESEEQGYAICFYAQGVPPTIINPKETWNWQPFVGAYQNWQSGELISAKVKFFFGTETPAEADFSIRKQ